jgi:hypothetical protein
MRDTYTTAPPDTTRGYGMPDSRRALDDNVSTRERRGREHRGVPTSKRHPAPNLPAAPPERQTKTTAKNGTREQDIWLTSAHAGRASNFRSYGSWSVGTTTRRSHAEPRYVHGGAARTRLPQRTARASSGIPRSYGQASVTHGSVEQSNYGPPTRRSPMRRRWTTYRVRNDDEEGDLRGRASVSAALIRPYRNYSHLSSLKLTCAAFARHTGECAKGLRNGSRPMNDDANSSAPYLNGRPSVPLINEDDDSERKD